MIKTIFKFLIIIILLLAVGLGIYWFLDRQQGGNGNIISNSNFNVGDFFPFGNGGDTGGSITNPTPTGPTNDTPQVPTTPPRLWQISIEPQSGAIASTSPETTFVRFIDKATGNVFESSLFVTGIKRLTNTTVPKVYEAMWQPKADSVVLRYLDERSGVVKTALGRLAPMDSIGSATSTEATELGLMELQASFLPDRISSLSVNPKTGALAYVVQNTTGAKIFVSGTAPIQIFESAINDIAVAWAGNSVAIQTKPSATAQGYLYFVKTTASPLERVVGGRFGLTTLPSPDGTKVFYSNSTTNSIESSLLTVATGATTELSNPTLADKCVWSKDSVYLYCAVPDPIPSGAHPDHWYQGKISFNDTFWRINTNTVTTEFIIDPSDSTEIDIDAVDLQLDPKEDYLIFTNKIDSSLWGLRIQRGS